MNANDSLTVWHACSHIDYCYDYVLSECLLQLHFFNDTQSSETGVASVCISDGSG